jgi:hypothetical protein
MVHGLPTVPTCICVRESRPVRPAQCRCNGYNSSGPLRVSTVSPEGLNLYTGDSTTGPVAGQTASAADNLVVVAQRCHRYLLPDVAGVYQGWLTAAATRQSPCRSQRRALTSTPTSAFHGPSCKNKSVAQANFVHHSATPGITGRVAETFIFGTL